MQYFIRFFITVYVLYVSGGFSAHHQELKNFTNSIWYMSSLLAAAAQNMQNIDNNKEYYNTLHLVGCIYNNILTMHGHVNVTN
jgi:hypothetical protein